MVTHGGDLIAALLVFGLLPFIIIGVTCFTKFAVVLAILRNALGIQQIPPNIVLYSMATIMSLYVMLPTFVASGQALEKGMHHPRGAFSQTQEIVKPFLDFTTLHVDPDKKAFFDDTAKKLWGEKLANDLTGPNATNLSKLIVAMPAFMVSELTKAFQIGFLLFLPFVVIDLICANVLLALGMSTLSPITVSLPIKLLLFIGLNGWQRILESLALSYI
jgi:type III secretion protein R